MDFDLTEEQLLLQKTVMEFTRQEIDPIAGKIDSENKLPDDLIKKMAQMKLPGMTLPEEYGGAGSGAIDCVLAIEQLSYSGTGAWRLAAFNNSIPESILKFGTKEQKQKYLPQVCEGNVYASIQFTEPDTDSNPKALTTKAMLEENHYVINGVKRLSTFGARDGFAVLYAKDEKGHCTAFIADKNVKGYSAGPVHALMGSGGIEAADIYYDNYRLPKENMLGTQGKGMEILLRWIPDEKIQQCGACLGIAHAALVEAISYTKIKNIGSSAQSGPEGIQLILAEMQSKLNAARWVTYRAAILKDKNDADWMTEAATARMFVVPAAMKIVEQSRRIHGSYGYVKEFKIERLYRAIADASAIAVSPEINKSFAGASLL